MSNWPKGEVDNVRVWLKGPGNQYRFLSLDTADFTIERDMEAAFFPIEEMERLIAEAKKGGYDKIAVSIKHRPANSLADAEREQWRAGDQERLKAEGWA